MRMHTYMYEHVYAEQVTLRAGGFYTLDLYLSTCCKHIHGREDMQAVFQLALVPVQSRLRICRIACCGLKELRAD